MTDTLDEKLQHLAIAAQQFPLGTPQRQRTVHQLLVYLQASKKLCRPSCPRQLLGSYDEIYAIALQNLFKYLYKRIEAYDPEKATVLQWSNFLLTRRFPDAIREIQGMKDAQNVRLDTIDLEPDLQANSRNSVAPEVKKILNFLKENPDGIFTKLCVNELPNVHFQLIATQFLSGYKWHEISQQLNIPVSTLSSFYQRNLKRFAPLFKEYLLL
ncbi:sigma-70 family RNA polymerase sigma factor [Lusitaniella coriacea]|uniref:sigma-70 family RNA polymerase sigma factor n=1 Tax=Lusitaniella coriacea TaxID=1983105 RepID=UPI003CF46E17